MSSSSWVLMEEECDCGGPPPLFHIPPPPVPPDLPCDLLDISCPAQLNMSDAEYKRIGSFPSVPVIITCVLLSAVIILVIAGIVWRKRRKGVTQSQTKDFDHHHHHPSLGNGNTGLLYEDLSHARPRPPIATPSIEMLDVNHHHHHGLPPASYTLNPKLDFSYFLNPPPIYEELPDLDNGHCERSGLSDDEFAEDELSVIDVPIVSNNLTACNGVGGESNFYNNRLSNGGMSMGRNSKASRAQSLNRKRNARNNALSHSAAQNNGFKSERSLDRHGGRKNNLNKYGGSGTTPRQFSFNNMMSTNGMRNGSGSREPLNNTMLHQSHSMKIPPHLVAVLTESGLHNRPPYEVLHPNNIHPNNIHGNNILGSNVNNGGMYPSSRSSGSSYGDGSTSSSTRIINPNGTSAESSSFDSGIGGGQISLTSCINSPGYDQQMQYGVNPYDYAMPNNGSGQFLNNAQNNFRRQRMTVDREHPLYSNHLLN